MSGKACEAAVKTKGKVSDTNIGRLDSAEWYYQVVAVPKCQLKNLVLLFCHYPKGQEVRG